MSAQLISVDRGLEGVEVGETAVSLVDGERGVLSYRGVNVNHLVNRHGHHPALSMADTSQCTGFIDQLHYPTTMHIPQEIRMLWLHQLCQTHP